MSDERRPRAADDFEAIRARMEELKRGRVEPAVVYCAMCGAADATEAPTRCTGMCQGC